MNKIIIILIVLILLIVFMPLKLRIKYNKKIDIDLYLFGFFSLRIDIDELFKKYFSDDKNNLTLKSIINRINTIIKLNKVIKKLFKRIIIETINFEILTDYENPTILVSLYYSWCLIKEFLVSNFKKINNHELKVNIGENKYKFSIIFRTYFFVIILVILLNIKTIILSQKKEVKSESSN